MVAPAFASALALLLTTSAQEAAPVPVADAPGDGLDDRISVRVELDGGEEIARSMHEGIVQALAKAEVEPSLPGDQPLEVVISPAPDNAGSYSVTYLHRGKVAGQWSCVCSGDEMRFRLGHESVTVWRVLAAEPQPSTNAPPKFGRTAVVEDQASPGAGASSQPRGRPVVDERLWFAGLLTTGIGLSVAATGGVALTAVGVSQNKLDRFGLALAVAGGVATVVGAPMWIAGARRLRQTRVSFVVPMRGRGALVSLTSRF